MGFAKAMCNNGHGRHREGKTWTRPTTYYSSEEVDDDTPKTNYNVRIIYSKMMNGPAYEGDYKYGAFWDLIERINFMNDEEYSEFKRRLDAGESSSELLRGKWMKIEPTEEAKVYIITDRSESLRKTLAKIICPENPDSVRIDIRRIFNIKDYPYPID